MTIATLEQLETAIAQLSITEQLWLMERLVHRIRKSSQPALQVDAHALAAMATDPAIQHEMQQINTEFAITEMDGLDSAA